VFRTVILVVLVALTALVAAPADAPVQASYVYSDSMSPTIEAGDGYVIVPADGVGPGDIVTFWSEARGEYTTHRIVAETPEGFHTRGDNNPTTDQAAGYPPVERADVVGAVLTWRGDPLVIPHLGSAVRFVNENSLLLLGLVGLAGLFGLRRGAPTNSRPETTRATVYPILLVGLLGLAALVAFGGASHSDTLLVTGGTASGSPQTLAAGASENLTYTVDVPARPLSNRVVHTTGLQGTEVSRNATAMTVNGTVNAPSTPGSVPVGVTVRGYPSVLPRTTIAYLDAIDPRLAALVCATLAFAPLFALTSVFVDGGERPRPSRSRTRRLLTEGFE